MVGQENLQRTGKVGEKPWNLKMNKIKNSLQKIYFFCSRRKKVQSPLVISKSKGPFETLRDIRTSTCRICKILENYKLNNQIPQINM